MRPDVCSFTDINFRQWATKIFLQPSLRKYRISPHISPPQISPSPHISQCCFSYDKIFINFKASFKGLIMSIFVLCKKIPVLHVTLGLDYLLIRLSLISFSLNKSLEFVWNGVLIQQNKVQVWYPLQKRTSPRNSFLESFYYTNN